MAIPERSSITSTSVLPDDSLVVFANRVVYDSNGSNPQFGAVWMRMSPQGRTRCLRLRQWRALSTALSTIRPTHFVPDAQGRWLVVSVETLWQRDGSDSAYSRATAGPDCVDAPGLPLTSRHYSLPAISASHCANAMSTGDCACAGDTQVGKPAFPCIG